MKFVNRRSELLSLKQHIKKGGLIIVYGRRRIGKTELLKQLKGKKVYHLIKEQI